MMTGNKECDIVETDMIKNVVMGIYIAGVVALGANCSGCGVDDNCEISEMKSCVTSEDCVLVSCGCCYEGTDEAVRQECKDLWYQINDCKPFAKICLAIACPKRCAACENNRCVVK